MKTSQRFRKWVRSYGVAALADDLSLSHQAVSKWACGHAVPAPKHYETLAKLARGATWNFADLLPR